MSWSRSMPARKFSWRENWSFHLNKLRGKSPSRKIWIFKERLASPWTPGNRPCVSRKRPCPRLRHGHLKKNNRPLSAPTPGCGEPCWKKQNGKVRPLLHHPLPAGQEIVRLSGRICFLPEARPASRSQPKFESSSGPASLSSSCQPVITLPHRPSRYIPPRHLWRDWPNSLSRQRSI